MSHGSENALNLSKLLHFWNCLGCKVVDTGLLSASHAEIKMPAVSASHEAMKTK